MSLRNLAAQTTTAVANVIAQNYPIMPFLQKILVMALKDMSNRLLRLSLNLGIALRMPLLLLAGT